MNVLKFNLQISNTKQGDCSDDEVDPDVGSSLPEQPTPGQVLHIDSADAQHLTGSLMNDFCCKIVQVCKNLEFRAPTPSGSPQPLKSCRTAMKSDTSIENYGKLHIHSKRLHICIERFLVHQSDCWFPCNANHLINILLNQVTQDQANCCIYSIL